MATAAEVLAVLNIIYSDIIEPLFCVLYAYILVRIIKAKSVNFRSEFYVFSVATGLWLLNTFIWTWDFRSGSDIQCPAQLGTTTYRLSISVLSQSRFVFHSLQIYNELYSGVFLNIDSMLSHICALSISIGKTLSVTTRFTAICLIHKKNVSV